MAKKENDEKNFEGLAKNLVEDNPGNKKAESDPIFDRYVNIDRYYTTSDGTSFLKKTDAINHAQKLDNKTINEVKK